MRASLGCVLLWALIAVPFAVPGENSHCAGFDSIYVPAPCGSTLAACLAAHPDCAIAKRLSAFAAWIDTVRRNDPCSTLVAALADRCETLTDTVRHAIDLRRASFAGALNAPVVIVMYVSTACPLCKRVYRDLCNCVTGGALNGKARLTVKVFSDRPADLALLAAGDHGKQQEFLCALAAVEDRLSGEILRKTWQEVGLLPDNLVRAIRDSALIKEALASRREGAMNGVSLTPAIFIDGKCYRGHKDPEWIADAAGFEYDRRRGAGEIKRSLQDP